MLIVKRPKSPINHFLLINKIFAHKIFFSHEGSLCFLKSGAMILWLRHFSSVDVFGFFGVKSSFCS